ncbi:MAG: alpha-amylase family glycosyl hydrolase [Vulcanimicrobiota bacterium]
MIDQNDIIYFVFTDRFRNGDPDNDYFVNPDDPQAYHGGDFAGIEDKIPYLKNLGVTAVWITPVYQNIKETRNEKFRHRAYHGYWPLDFEKVDRHLYSQDPDIPDGSMKHLKKLSDALHKKGIKLVLDMVVNHVGYEHPWTDEKPDWFHSEGHNDDIRKYLYGLPDLDLSNPDVIDYFIQNIIEWYKEGNIDGIRMDAVKHVDKTFWYHLKASLRGACPGVQIFGEAFYYNPEKVSLFQNFFDFDSMLDFPMKNALHEVFVNEESFFKIARPRISDFEQSGVLDQDLKYNNPYRLITFLNNHDVPRFITDLLNKFGHSGQGRKTAVKTYKMAYTFLLTCRGIPQIYYGDEIGLEGGENPDNRRDMPWDLFSGHSPDKNKVPEKYEIFQHVKNIIDTRKKNQALRFGTLITLWVDENLMIHLRFIYNNIVISAFHNGREPMKDYKSIPVEKNSHIPSRIKNILKSKKKASSICNQNNYIYFSGGEFKIKLDDKDSQVYIIN